MNTTGPQAFILTSHPIRTTIQVVLTSLLLTCLLISCSSTGESIRKQSTIAQIYNIGVVVQVLNEFEVLNATEESALIGAIFFGIIGDQIQQSIRRANDEKVARSMEASLTAAGYRKRTTAKFLKILQDSKKFRSVQVFDQVALAQYCDGVLVIEVEQWGVRPIPVAKGNNKPMKVGHMISYELIHQPSGAVVWSRRQLFLSDKERTLDNYQANVSLLEEDIWRSLEHSCTLIANQLIY